MKVNNCFPNNTSSSSFCQQWNKEWRTVKYNFFIIIRSNSYRLRSRCSSLMNTWARANCATRPRSDRGAQSTGDGVYLAWLNPRSKSVTDLHSSDIVYKKHYFVLLVGWKWPKSSVNVHLYCSIWEKKNIHFTNRWIFYTVFWMNYCFKSINGSVVTSTFKMQFTPHPVPSRAT